MLQSRSTYYPKYSQVHRVLGIYQGYILTSNLDIFLVHILAKVGQTLD